MALRNLNQVVARYEEDYAEPSVEVRTCTDLPDAPQDLGVKAHIGSHRFAARWLLGARIRDHLMDLVDGLNRDRSSAQHYRAGAFWKPPVPSFT